jgi:hypothetical protein
MARARHGIKFGKLAVVVRRRLVLDVKICRKAAWTHRCRNMFRLGNSRDNGILVISRRGIT